MVFLVVVYGYESWTIKEAECWRIDAFELWCWKRLLRVPWTARRSSQLILKEISPEYSLQGLMLNLNLQYFGHLMWRTDSLGKTLMLGKIESGRRRGWRRMRWLGGIINLMAMRLGKFQELVIYREAWRAAVHGVAKSWTRLSWTELVCMCQSQSPYLSPLSPLPSRKHGVSRSVMSDSLQPHGPQPTSLLCPWDSAGKNTGVNCHFLLQGIILTRGSNPHLLSLLHCKVDSLPLSHWDKFLVRIK